jgi:hypothetical protein
MIIMLFPAFVLIAELKERHLDLFWVRVFMIYMCVISLILILYEIYSCTCGYHGEPSYLYQYNDLDDHYNEVWKVRNDFYENTRNSKE